MHWTQSRARKSAAIDYCLELFLMRRIFQNIWQDSKRTSLRHTGCILISDVTTACFLEQSYVAVPYIPESEGTSPQLFFSLVLRLFYEHQKYKQIYYPAASDSNRPNVKVICLRLLFKSSEGQPVSGRVWSTTRLGNCKSLRYDSGTCITITKTYRTNLSR